MLRDAFQECAEKGKIAFVAYITAGYPQRNHTVPSLLALQEGGADVIEIGVPFTDPLADGPTIQRANQGAIDNGVTSIRDVLDLVCEAREKGLTVPIVFMGYCNPFINYEGDLMKECSEAGVNGFLITDMPPEEAVGFKADCRTYGLSFIPLIAPTTTDERLRALVHDADSFIYAVSLTGVTGARTELPPELGSFVERIRSVTDAPIAVGFGISNSDQFASVGKVADGVVVGSAIVSLACKNEKKIEEERTASLVGFCKELTQHAHSIKDPMTAKQESAVNDREGEGVSTKTLDSMFGEFGGCYVPETLMGALDELQREYEKCKDDPEFLAEVESYNDYIGRPSSLHKAERLSELAGGATIWLKREDCNHTGAHKINNAIAQCLLAKRIGKTRIIAETGAGQHGVASATICAKLDLPLTVYMGAEDVRRQALNVFRMELMGATCTPVDSGTCTLKDAINEAMRDWVTNIHDTHYLVGSAIGPHPFPTIVRDFQSVIGRECRQQCLEGEMGQLPDAIVACVGGGSNAIGIFHPFKNDKSVRLVGVEAGGDGVDTDRHSATLSAGTPGVLHGTRTYLLQDGKTGQITGTHSISAGLDYPGVGPEHAHLKLSDRAEYVAVTDAQCLEGFVMLSKYEGIIPALETSHAVYHAVQLAKTLPSTANIVLCVSGRGDKDVDTVRHTLKEEKFSSASDMLKAK